MVTVLSSCTFLRSLAGLVSFTCVFRGFFIIWLRICVWVVASRFVRSLVSLCSYFQYYVSGSVIDITFVYAIVSLFFCFNYTATTQIYILSLPVALPLYS